MSAEVFEREKLYLASLVIAKQAYKLGLLTGNEYCQFDTMLRVKHRPILASLYPVEAPKNVDFIGV